MEIRLYFEISQEAYQLLNKINEAGFAEYRDTDLETIEDFKSSEISKIHDEDWFLHRNFGGTAYLLPELIKYGLIESDTESWHETWKLSYFGQEVVQNFKQVLRDARISDAFFEYN
jgi:hypothetical protein